MIYSMKQLKHMCVPIFVLVILLSLLWRLLFAGGPKKNFIATDCYWNVSINSNKPGSSPVRNASTVGHCMQRCSQDPKCDGFDFSEESSDVKCWLGQVGGFETVYNRAHKVVHYDKVCGREKPKDEECSWMLTPNKHSLGSSVMGHILNKRDCLAECNSIWNCWGVDWNEHNPQKCWLASDYSLDISNSPGIDHYTKICGAGMTTPPTTTPFGLFIRSMTTVCRWKMYSNNFSPNGVLKPAYKNLKSCLDGCLDTQSCFSISWSEKSDECWFSTSEMFGAKQGFKHLKYVCKLIKSEFNMKAGLKS
ncbi:hypothetical protein HELRODRAFT_193987 [Helobdella robusta]|uniref:Apple domain-containing protein n=1 Tax=Helobdella robusta TaxID=6412 RepID=T1FVJ6_HELRO|nr:hypothetical protein HELRODRAFT_193987 [Helobdella robusta]ESN93606.1 hypothetical protein HELRODRAFT_193987 [Helobdella robusta]